MQETTRANRHLYGKLSDSIGAAKTFPGAAPRNTALPFATYNYIPDPDDGDTNTQDGTRVLVRLTYLVVAHAESLSQAQSLADSFDSALVDPEGEVVDGMLVNNVRRKRPYEQRVTEGDALYWQVGGYYGLEVIPAP